MIQNLENKMELQINSVETRIEKIQEMFKKDLEKNKKDCSIHLREVGGGFRIGNVYTHGGFMLMYDKTNTIL